VQALLLTEPDVANPVGMTARSVRRRACEAITEKAAEPCMNARRPPRHQLLSVSLNPQGEWLSQQQKSGIQTPDRFDLALTLPRGSNLSDEDQAEAKRRYQIIEPIIAPERFRLVWIEHNLQRGNLIESLAQQHKIGQRTLYTWLKAWRQDGLPGLVRRDRSDKGASRCLNAAAMDFILVAALPRRGAYGELSIREIYRAYEEERAWRAAHAEKKLNDLELQQYARYVDSNTGRLSASAQLPEAAYETLRLWYNRIPDVVKVLGRQGEEAFHNTQEILSFRCLSSIQPLDYVVMDHRRLDLFCLVPVRGGWNLARPWLTAAIDMRTRKWLAWAIIETPSSDSIATVLKRVFLIFGLPIGLYWDNGKDFTCEWFEGRQVRTREASRISELAPEWRGVLGTLGVRVHHAIVRRARSKIIEPNFVRTAEFDKTTPWWCGNKPTARPERFEALMDQHEAWLRGEASPAFPTIAEIAALYDEQIETLNERDLKGEGMQKVTPTGRGWMCPNEAWDIFSPRVPKRMVDVETLQFCFAKRRTVTVRNGEVQTTFGADKYHYRLLGNPQALMVLNGREVEFAYDALDLETVAIYCESRFVGLAANVELRRMGEQDFVEDEKLRRASRRQVKRAIAAAHRDIYVPGVEERAARRAEVRPERIEPGRVEVPADLPEAVVTAAKAAEDSRRFCFAGVNAAAIGSETRVYRDDDPDDDGALRFWGDK
jgi:transposase